MRTRTRRITRRWLGRYAAARSRLSSKRIDDAHRAPDAGVAVQAVATVVCLLANTGSVRAQDLEPEAYLASPVRAAFLVVGLARSSGSVLTNPTLPLTDVEAKIKAVPLAAGYTCRLFGKLTEKLLYQLIDNRDRSPIDS